MQKKTLNPAADLARMQDLCNRAEHCSYEIEKKLRDRGYPQALIRPIIANLEESGLIDNRRFARAYVHSKAAYSGWGRLKIRSGLIAKRIDRDTIESALIEEIDNKDYTLGAFKAIRSKLRSLPPDTPPRDAKMKLMRFGASRGYEASLIIKILSSPRLWNSTKSLE